MPILIGSLTFLLIIGVTVSVAQQPTQNCDPAYPKDLAGNEICIPSPPPDLDCKDISYRRFVVLQPDPHNFDTDKDGIGCEGR
jgi:micrococcal nuclease